MKNQRKPQWIVTACQTSDHSYSHLHLTFRLAYRLDAAELAANAIRRGSDSAYYTERAAKLREETGTTVFFDDCHRTSMTVRWQANHNGRDAFGGDTKVSEWYGPRVDEADLSADVARALAKLAKVSYDMSPQGAIAALKATGVKYVSGTHGWTAAELDLTSPLDAAEETKIVAAC